MKEQFIERDVNIVLERGVDAEGNSTHTFVISDESVDSHGTVFSMSGWKLDGYSRNPIVTYGHPDVSSPDPNVIIGRSVVTVSAGKLIGSIEYDMDNPLAREVKRKVDAGFINMASIRAYVEDGHYDEERDVIVFTAQRLIDWGIVMHGSNKNAMKRRDLAMSLEIEIPDKKEEVLNNPDPNMIAEARGLIASSFSNLNLIKK